MFEIMCDRKTTPQDDDEQIIVDGVTWRDDVYGQKGAKCFSYYDGYCIFVCFKHGKGEKKSEKTGIFVATLSLSGGRYVAAAAAVIADSDCVFLMLFLGIVALNMNAARGKCGTKETNKAKVPQ